MFQQSAANLSFFAYRPHNEMLDKKINSTHDCLDHIKLFNFWESKFQEISPLPRTRQRSRAARVQYFKKRIAVIVQPLCMLAQARSHSRRSNLVTHAIGQVRKIFSITFTANFRFKLAIWWGWHETSDYLGGAPSKRFATLRNVPINSASSSSLVLPSALGPVPERPIRANSGQARIQDFFRRECTRLLLYFNTNKPHSFFVEYQLY